MSRYIPMAVFLYVILKPSPIPEMPRYIHTPAVSSYPMVRIDAGFFRMGHRHQRSSFGQGRPKQDPSQPVHTVFVGPFYMDRAPLTYRDFEKMVDAGVHPNAYWLYDSYHRSDQPVTGLSWHMSACLANLRSVADHLKPVYRVTDATDDWGYPVIRADRRNNGYRLPTEAQYEYAARGGFRQKPYPWGDRFDPSWANYDEGHGVPKGRWWRLANNADQVPNPYDLLGMAGNVYQWIDDWYGETYYADSPIFDPHGPESGQAKVLRGGSWGSPSAEYLTVYHRNYAAPDHYNYDIGLRMVLPVRSIGHIRRSPRRTLADALSLLAGCRAILRQGHARRRTKSVWPDTTSAQYARLAEYIRYRYPESIYFLQPVDQQEIMDPNRMARLIVDISHRFHLHPLFLTGVMASESGFGTVSFARWFNNPMAYDWANRKMRRGLPIYKTNRDRNDDFNRRYRNLPEAFEAFCRGIRHPRYIRAARYNFHLFHYIYVGYNAFEWMNTLNKVYLDLAGIRLDDGYTAGSHIYLDGPQFR